MIASSQIFEFIAALYSISTRLFMGTRERRVNVGKQISSFQLPPPPAPQEKLRVILSQLSPSNRVP